MKKIRLSMVVEVPDDTDPAFVAVTLTTALEDGGGKVSNWGEWTTGPLEVAQDAAVVDSNPIGGATGGPGTTSTVRHAHGRDDPCNSRCCIISGGGGR